MRARARARVRVCFRPPKKMQGASPGITFFVVHKPYWSSVYVCTSSIVVFGFEKRRSWNARKHRRDENVGGKGKRANSFRSAPPRYSTGTTAFDIARTHTKPIHTQSHTHPTGTNRTQTVGPGARSGSPNTCGPDARLRNLPPASELFPHPRAPQRLTVPKPSSRFDKLTVASLEPPRTKVARRSSTK